MGTRAGVARAHCHSSDLKEGEIKTGASKTSHLTAEQWTTRWPAQALRFSSETALFYLHSSAVSTFVLVRGSLYPGCLTGCLHS